MFESVQTESVPERLRNAAFAPMAAFLFAQLYFALYPLLAPVPAVLFWSVDATLLGGTVTGLIAIARVIRSPGTRPDGIRGRAIAWLVAAILAELLCAQLFLALTFPWL